MFDQVLNFIFGGLGFLFVITLVVFVHELGHFSAGRFFGVRIDSFSIGFGRSIAGFTDRHGTQWKIGWLPLGGYVKFWGDEGVSSTPDHEKIDKVSAEERSKSFHHKPLYQKAIIAVAGPVANFGLAIFILSSLFLIYGDVVDAPRVGGVKPGLPADAAGLMPGDLILEIDGDPIQEFSEILRIVTVANLRELDFHIQRGTRDFHLKVTPRMIPRPDNFGDKIMDPGIGIHSVIPGKVKRVVAGSPAGRAGILPSDVIVQVDGKYLESLNDFSQALETARGKKVQILVSRAAETAQKPWGRREITLILAPAPIGSVGDPDRVVLEAVGLEFMVPGAPKPKVRVTFGLFDAVSKAIGVTEFIVVKTIYFIGQLIAGTGDYQQLSGPLGIASVSGKVAIQFGVVPLINLAAVLSVSIGLLNLFPIPMLDGGHILYYGIEAVRGRPLGERAQELGFRIGLAFVVSLLLFATWNDLTKLGLFGVLGFNS